MKQKKVVITVLFVNEFPIHVIRASDIDVSL